MKFTIGRIIIGTLIGLSLFLVAAYDQAYSNFKAQSLEIGIDEVEDLSGVWQNIQKTAIQIGEDHKEGQNALSFGATRGLEQVEDKGVIYNGKESAKQFLQEYMPESPLLDYLDEFFKYEDKKARLALAIAYNESHAGTYAPTTQYYNAWGYGCNRNNQRWNCGWTSWEQSINRFMELAGGYLSIYDGSWDSLISLQVKGYHPVSADKQQAWADNIAWIINQF